MYSCLYKNQRTKLYARFAFLSAIGLNRVLLLHVCFMCALCSRTTFTVGCFGLNGPLRQYFSLYRAVSQREGEKKRNNRREKKMSKHPQPALTERAVGPCPTLVQISRTPRNWKVTQRNRTTRPPPTTFTDFILHHSSRTEIHE